jgi:hypothetical protein
VSWTIAGRPLIVLMGRWEVSAGNAVGVALARVISLTVRPTVARNASTWATWISRM